MSDTNPALRPARLSPGQWFGLVATGAILWPLVALMLRALAPLGAYHGVGLAILYLALVPATMPLILAIRAAFGLSRARTLVAVAVVTASASFFDGLALALMPALYGADPLGAAAALLWGVAVALSLGAWMTVTAPRD